MPSSTNSLRLLSEDAVEAVFDRHYQSILRWRQDETLNFPKPLKIRGRLYWREEELTAWVMSQQEAANESAA